MVPSGYKEDVVYSVVPSNGSGDLSFTRASNGTRVNSAGLVEVVAWNLASYSEDFANAYWDKPSATITSNTTTNPINGATNADTITGNGYISKQIASNGVHTFSIYTKANSATQMRLNIYDGVTDRGVYYNLSTGQISSSYGTIIASTIESVGDGWYKISITTNNATFSDVQIHRDSTGTCYIWGAQLNIGSTAKPYFPTTDRLNVPRLTYQNGGGGCPSLLLEKQSTNLVTYSEQFDNAVWTKASATVSANSTTSPDGTQNADLIYPTSSASNLGTYQFNASIISVVGTVSCYVKSAGKNWALLGTDNTSNYNVSFDLVNGVVGSVPSGYTATIQSVGNGWYRITATFQSGSALAYPFVGVADNTNRSVTADGTNGLYIWGFQAEVSSYPTSYIPTTSSSATRVADLATVNLPNTNMTFTAYLELDEASLGTPAGDWFSIFSNVSALGRAYGYANQFGFADAYSLGVSSGAKMVWKQESGSTAKIFKGGALVGTSTTGAYTDPFNRLRIDGALLDKSVKIKQFVFFDNALTDAECIQLTA